MSFTRPTPATFKASFPAFASVDDVSVQSALDGAPVDDTWIEGDFPVAIGLYAAWWLTDNGLGSTAEGKRAGSGMSDVTRLKSGSLDISFNRSGAGGAGVYGSNSFGLRYYSLLRRNRGGPRITPVLDNCINPFANDPS